jgi:hypothetical protein
MRSSLSLSLSIGEERNRFLELERNSPPTKKRERDYLITLHERTEKFWEKKGRLKTRSFLSLSLCSSLSFKGGEKE